MYELFHTASALRLVSESLAWPTHVLLLGCVVVALFELGLFVSERLGWGLPTTVQQLVPLARARVGRADILSRIGPMLGLMGTLIPLGPGLSALGRGDVASLANAVTAAFDTTVLGLAVGIVGYCLGRARRSRYDRLLDTLEGAPS